MRFRIVVIVLLLSIVSAYSQSAKDTTEKSIFKKHSFQYGITGLFQLTAFEGSLLSYKYHFNDNNAIRFSLGFNADNLEENFTYKKEGEDGKGKLVTSKPHSNFLITAEWLSYFRPSKEIKLFAGIGPRISYNKETYSEIISQINGDTTKYVWTIYNYLKDYNFGLTTSFGIEWFFYKNFMSLHAQYSLAFLFLNIKHDSSSTFKKDNGELPFSEKHSRETDAFRIISNGVLLGLSVYF